MSIQTVNAEILQGAFTNEQLDSITDAVKFARSRIAQKNIFTMRTGANVQFTSTKNGMTYKGTVEKVGRKYVTVRTPQGGWRVPANMLSAA
jgi:phosphoribosylaminoimidazole carboxylase (NCAIR synthetase)